MRRCCGFLLCLACVTPMWGQSAKDAFSAFRDSVVHKDFMLRNFSGSSEVHAVWKDGALQLDQPRWRAFAEVQVNSAEMHRQKIKLDCERRVMTWNEQNQLAPFDIVDSVEVVVDLGSTDPAQVLPQLRSQLFYTSSEDALAAVPKLLKNLVPGHAVDPRKRAMSMTGSCDCAERETQACSTTRKPDGMVQPKAVRTVDPEFSDQARKRKLNGNVLVAFIVDEAGQVQDVWVTQPLPLGLSGRAAEAVLQYVFDPATCHGQPIAMPLIVEVNFQIF